MGADNSINYLTNSNLILSMKEPLNTSPDNYKSSRGEGVITLTQIRNSIR
jgi:hypothetical protein